MPDDSASQRYKFTFILLLTIAALIAFLTIIQTFLLDILLGMIFSGMLVPVFKRVLKRCKGNRPLAAGLVVGVTLLAVAIPFLGVMALVGSEALDLSKNVVDWTRQAVNHPYSLVTLIPEWLVPREWVQSAIGQLQSRIGDVIRVVSGFLSGSVSSFTQGAIDLFLHLFVIFFGMFYFLLDGPKLIEGFMDHVPLGREEARTLVDKSLKITSATLESMVAVGFVQGGLVGIAFAVAGLGQPWFWGAVVAVLSVVPALGAPIVYVPAGLYLLLSGDTAMGVGMLLWGALVIGSVDNLLRLWIIGRGASLPDFLVFISTVGGLITLGAPGLLIGPVMIGVLTGVLDLYKMVLQSSGISTDVVVTPVSAEDAAAIRMRNERDKEETVQLR